VSVSKQMETIPFFCDNNAITAKFGISDFFRQKYTEQNEENKYVKISIKDQKNHTFTASKG